MTWRGFLFPAIFLVVGNLCIVAVPAFLVGRYIFPDVPPEATYCDVPPVTFDLRDLECSRQLIECDATYNSWKERAEECLTTLGTVWSKVPNYEQGDSDVLP